MGNSLNTMESPSDVDGLGHDMEALDLENEPVLTLLPADDGARVMCGSVVVIQRAVERALPAGCVVAKIQQVERSGAIRVRLGFKDVAATAALRDAVVLEDGAFEQKLNAALPHWRRPATDDELVQLGYAKLAGREFFVNPNEAQLERPTVPVPASARLATDDELQRCGYETLATASGREIYVRLNEADFRRPTVPVAASAHSATDEELAALGYEELTAASGQALYVNRAANEAQLERPTVPVPASARPATDDELHGLGYETLAASGREFYVRLHEAHFQRPTVPVPPTRRPATDEELAELGYQKETLADGREFYRDAKETHRPRPLLAAAPAAALRVDRGAFLDCYARLATRLSALTPHQREKLDAVRAARVAVLTAPAGGGKTFVAIQLAREVLQEAPDSRVLFMSRNPALALFVVKWLVAAKRTSAQRVADRIEVLVAPFGRGPRQIRVKRPSCGREMLVLVEPAEAGEPRPYDLVVVDEAHHLAGDEEAREALRAVGAGRDGSRLLLLGDASQATTTSSTADLARSVVDLPVETVVETVALTEVVRSTKRIVAGAKAFQLEAGRKADTRSHHSESAGPPLEARLFDVVGDEAACYVREVVAAIESIRRQLHGVGLDDRVAVACPDAGFAARLRAPLSRALGESFELVDAATASATLPLGEDEDWLVVVGDGGGNTDERESSFDARPQRVVVDTVDGLDGLERLIVVCAGLDRAISEDAATLETRSRLYRAMTRAQLAVAVVNHRVPGGWLEFLGRLELAEYMGFDEERAKRDRLETAADDVVASCADKGGDGVREVPDEAPGAALQREEDSSVAERLAVGDGDGHVAAVETVERESPAAAVPKVSQSIWDTSSCESVDDSTELRFMPFSMVVDLSKLAELATLRGHQSWVHGVAVFPDGRRVVSGSADGTVKVWDAATGECVATLAGYSSRVRSVAVFPDGRRVVSGSSDKTAKVWDAATGECVATLAGHSGGVSSVAVFPDGRRVVSGSYDKTIKVWDAATGECVATLAGHSSVVHGVAVFPDGRRVVSGGGYGDNTVKVWDAATGECVATLAGPEHLWGVYSVAVFPDGRRVVSGLADNTVKVWDAATGQCVATLAGHSGQVMSVAVFPDGRRVVSGSYDNTVKVWDAATGECVATLAGHSDVVWSVAVLPDGRRVVSGSKDKTVKVWGC